LEVIKNSNSIQGCG